MKLDVSKLESVNPNERKDRVSLTKNGITVSTELTTDFLAEPCSKIAFFLDNDQSLALIVKDTQSNLPNSFSCPKESDYLRITKRNIVKRLYEVLGLDEDEQWVKLDSRYDSELPGIVINLADAKIFSVRGKKGR